MFAAKFAKLFHAGAELFARAVKPDGKVVRTEAKRGGNLILRLTIQVNPLQKLLILIRQFRQKTFQALADGSLVGIAGSLWQLGLEFFESALPNIVSPVKIDNR